MNTPCTYAFHESFPAALLPVAVPAMEAACAMWAFPGLPEWRRVQQDGGGVDLLIATDHREPWVSQAMQHINAGPTRLLLVNEAVPWRTKWFQFWRFAMDPVLFAHEMGHFFGLPHAASREDSVMQPNPITAPTLKDKREAARRRRWMS